MAVPFQLSFQTLPIALLEQPFISLSNIDWGVSGGGLMSKCIKIGGFLNKIPLI
jgi:hypothetical protein